MSPAGDPERRFTREETALILGRVAELEASLPAPPAEGDFTLDELVAIGREAGLDPATVRRAAAFVPSAPGPLQRLLLGGSARPSARGLFPGRLPPSRHAELAALLDGTFGRHGTVTTEDGLWQWEETHGPGRTVARVRREDGDLEVLVEADRQGWAFLSALVSAGVALVALAALGGAVGPGGGLLLTAAAAWAGARLLFPALTRGLGARVQRAALEVAARVEDPGVDAGERAPGRLPAPGGPPEAP